MCNIFFLLKIFLRFKTGFPPQRSEVGVSVVDVVALLPCCECEFLYYQTRRLIYVEERFSFFLAHDLKKWWLSLCSREVVAKPSATPLLSVWMKQPYQLHLLLDLET